MIYMTLDCVRPTQSSVIQIIHHNIAQKCYSVNFPKCPFVIIVIYVHFTYMSQGCVESHLRYGGTYNNHVIANCPQSVPVTEF